MIKPSRSFFMFHGLHPSWIFMSHRVSSRGCPNQLYKSSPAPYSQTRIRSKSSVESIKLIQIFLPTVVSDHPTTTSENVNHSKLLWRPTNVFDPFSLDVWDPFRDFPSSDVSKETSALVNARVDWKETPEAHVFKADLPGIKKEEVKVEVEEGNVLQIRGERNVEKEDKNDKWHRVERSSRSFTRRFRLPENAKMEEVKAAMENGVLTITVPKAEVKKPDVKSIEISG